MCGSELTLTAYHWSTFGSTDGVPLEIPDLPLDQPLFLTSLIKRSFVHLVMLDIDSNSCRSLALDITRKVTEFTLKEKGVRGGEAQSENVTSYHRIRSSNVCPRAFILTFNFIDHCELVEIIHGQPDYHWDYDAGHGCPEALQIQKF
jgi:hypothetical protein